MNRPPSGVLCRIGVRIMRKGVDQPKTTWEHVNHLNIVGTTKNTIGNTVCCNRFKSCRTKNVPLLKKAHEQAHLKFIS